MQRALGCQLRHRQRRAVPVVVRQRGRMRTCNCVGPALNRAEVEALDRNLCDLLAEAFPGKFSVTHRIFATSAVAA